MARSAASSVDAYLLELPEQRRRVAAALRKLILKHLPAGYVEAMNRGMRCNKVPLKVDEFIARHERVRARG
jgi:hypothetical protein